MTITEKLHLMEEINKRNDERWKKFAEDRKDGQTA